jgi:hypothetical protein
MVGPFVPPGIEERRQLADRWIDSQYVWIFIAVAIHAAIRQIPGDSTALVAAGDDLIDLEGDAGFGLRQATVFASATCPLPHQPDQGGIHAGGPQACFLRERRALARIRSKKELTRR